MIRALVLATLFVVVPRADSGQASGVLHIKVVVTDAEGRPAPVPRHALLISDNPASAVPRLIVTNPDGTADVTLRPGNYTVESDQPVVFLGKAYQWAQSVDIVGGRDAVLELTAGNAEVTAVSATTGSDPWLLLRQWQDSVIEIWTPGAHASGFLVDPTGLIATNQRVVGKAMSVEVQLARDVKVAASVVVADPERDVALLRIHPKMAASVRPLPLGCAREAKPPVLDGQAIFTIGVALRQQKAMTSGTVKDVGAHWIAADLVLPSGSTGGPVFTADGSIIGITSIVDDRDRSRDMASRVVPIDEACGAVASAEKKKAVEPPPATLLPVEPARQLPVEALENAVKRRAGSLSPYSVASSGFDVAFITPVLAYGAGHPPSPAGRERSGDTRAGDLEQALALHVMDFGSWTEYVRESPPVLLVRVTPRLTEGLWTTVARPPPRVGGVSLPPIKHFKPGFSRMRTYCGDAEVTPIHPFTLEFRLSDNNSIREGLYVLDPAALGPHCATVRLVLYSEKKPGNGETVVVDPGVIEKIWQDFAPYRASQPASIEEP